MNYVEKRTVEAPPSSKKVAPDPRNEPLRMCLLVATPDTEADMSYGSGRPFRTSCLLLTILEAHIANVVRTTPIPQEKRREDTDGSAERSRRTCK